MSTLALETSRFFYLAINKALDLLPSLKVLVANISAKIEENRIVNRTIKELSSLSNRELADLGIHRGQIPSIARETVKGDN
jgi:uncharacterized protein YjiS (DUF1127 family)|tara:strand:+ start:928 stop:1170 length:243 start_codon:yes stop_codon:yes gene_type:complete